MIRVFLAMALLLGVADGGQAADPLEQVEQDQASETISSDDIFNRNLARNSRRDYTHASSYKPGRFAWYAHDGNRKTAWIADSGHTEAVLELSWGLAELIDQVTVFESNSGNIKTLTLELFDGTQWRTIPPERPETRSHFRFHPRPASGLRITLTTAGKPAGVAEVEVFNSRSASPLSRYGSADLIAALQQSHAVILCDGSPFMDGRAGRKLIKPRAPEACLADRWTPAVLAGIAAGLGGRVETAADDSLQVNLNGQEVRVDAGADRDVCVQIQQLADQAGLEYRCRGPLVMVGTGLAALDQDHLAAELNERLGRNPFRVRPRSAGPPDAVVTPTLTPVGETYQWAGFRSTAIPETNTAAWLKYAETKAVRTWVGAPRYMNMYIRPEERVETAADFERLKALIRSAPETNGIVAMRAFLNKHHANLTAEFATYQKLGISVINQTGPKTWPDTLHDDFINWASCYTLTYYLAKNFQVAAHQYGNEPDWYFNQSTDEQVRRRLTLIADAVHTAIDDVNRDGNGRLEAVFAAPVLASDFQGRNARIMMQTLHTRYDGSRSSAPLFQLFNRHRYSGRPHQNALEIRQAKLMMEDEGGVVLPQVFTELNYATGRHWGRPTTTFTNDTPAVFTAMASIWGTMMAEQGVAGIYVFKLNDPGIWSWNDTGRFSNTVTYSMQREKDPDAVPEEIEQISYGTKNFEVCRLFSRGFHGSRPLLKTNIACSDPEYGAWTAFDEASQRFFIWSVQPNEFEQYAVELDLSQLKLPPAALVTVETVSGARHGEVTEVLELPDDGKLRVIQPPLSAMLVTVQARPLSRQSLAPAADATVIQGDQAPANVGSATWLRVGRHTDPNRNQISLLRFRLPDEPEAVARAVLKLHGNSVSTQAYDGGFLVRVYAVPEADWDEATITAVNAPGIFRSVSSLQRVDLEHFPVGHVTCFREPATLWVDVTAAVEEARQNGRQQVAFVLIREIHWPGENTDDVSAEFSAREAGKEKAPALALWHEAR